MSNCVQMHAIGGAMRTPDQSAGPVQRRGRCAVTTPFARSPADGGLMVDAIASARMQTRIDAATRSSFALNASGFGDPAQRCVRIGPAE